MWLSKREVHLIHNAWIQRTWRCDRFTMAFPWKVIGYEGTHKYSAGYLDTLYDLQVCRHGKKTATITFGFSWVSPKWTKTMKEIHFPANKQEISKRKLRPWHAVWLERCFASSIDSFYNVVDTERLSVMMKYEAWDTTPRGCLWHVCPYKHWFNRQISLESLSNG